MSHGTEARILGVLGGMGPLASAEFVQTIYRLRSSGPEQQAPALVLHSDPSIPDRTAAILAGDTRELAARLTAALAALAATGAHRIVIACVTVHCVLPEVPEPLRDRVVSLLDLAVDELAADGGRFVLLATHGTRQARIFERHPRWSEVAERVCFPDGDDQHHLHDAIYRVKQQEPIESLLPWLDSLPAKYGAAGLLFGCTELHLLQRALLSRGAAGTPLRVIDPLFTAARDVDRLLALPDPELNKRAG